ncbi:Peptide-N(4)-(N-acetyl-beta-glucosaminyl)asparagine amidase [Savitreella phatthalungensis]
MDPSLARSLTARFAQMMSSRRSQPAVAATTNADTRQEDDGWYRQVVSLSFVPARYEKAGLLDTALDKLDLGKIYEYAEEIEAEGKDGDKLGHQDYVIRGLLRYFKRDFFTWVNSPVCSRCSGETAMHAMGSPSADEQRGGAGRVELHRCKNGGCGHVERFPRYDDPETLLSWRKGRCGEWANCFTLCCIALGSRARWVWNAEDHVWTEVYSESLCRWVHVDSCEEAFDEPQIYAVGWGKKMSYCLAFGSDGAADVTRRYVRKPEQALPRQKGPETSLTRALKDINDRLGVANDSVKNAEREAEERELASYVTTEQPTSTAEEQPRESGSTAWKTARGEMGDKS